MKKPLLILASTTLGDPQDIPARSLAALRISDLLVFEEDRPARSFLKAAGIHRDYLKLSEHEEKDTLQAVQEALSAGQTVVYMSDQGTPNFADPGRVLIRLAQRLGVAWSVIPGPSSLTAALSACPFETETFSFLGFLPRETNQRDRAWRAFKNRKECIVLMDTPYRLAKVLSEGAAHLPERGALLALDISGPEERFVYDSLKNLHRHLGDKDKIPFVLVLEAL